MSTWDALYGPNLGYALELWERYQEDPDSVDASTRAAFDRLASQNGSLTTLARPTTETPIGPNGARSAPVTPEPVAPNGGVAPPTSALGPETVQTIVLAARLARSIREYGHLAANIDPLGAPRPGDPMLELGTHRLTDADLAARPATIVWPNDRLQLQNCLQAIEELRRIYCGTIGYEFDHIADFDERAWLHQTVEDQNLHRPLPRDQQWELLERLTEVESFERFLHTVFQGQKRFSIEGDDALIPMLDQLITRSAEAGTREVLIGMAHRGRLNVLAHVLGKPYGEIFAEFHSAAHGDIPPSEGSQRINQGWTGDVKYHLGARRTVGEAHTVQVALADNPSHLEFVNPVIEGATRAGQDDRNQPGAPRQDMDRAISIAIHGDAAFPGEGVVAETLNLSRLDGYETGGTIHIIVNNQIGFTTLPEQGRSTVYASDLAKGFNIPIVHVNADDPEACLLAIELAHVYRQYFHRDFLIDLVGYRRWGHNEGDEPSFTQPRMYGEISHHPTVRTLYAKRLEREGIVSSDQVAEMQRTITSRLQAIRDQPAPSLPEEQRDQSDGPEAFLRPPTTFSTDELRGINEALLQRPADFHAFPRLERLIARRREQIEKPGGIDWSLGEALAFGSILADGTPIRLSGQDTERGTFSQRHLVLHDPDTGRVSIPLQHLPQARASFAVYNSPLAEAAVLGFEYGYSVHGGDAFVAWEAQFGDFANAAQVLIDSFLAAARAKWRQQPALTLLLPHGYEGQGPEHSSARLERYLQLASEGNLRIANCTTAAQYFHLLRLQAISLRDQRRPLIILTPKSLLRHPGAASSLADLSEGFFHPVLDDVRTTEHPDAVRRLIFCSGKVALDLEASRAKRAEDDTSIAIVRIELLYPFPAASVEAVLRHYGHAREIVWLQEEPRNMGAWSFVSQCMGSLLSDGLTLEYVGRPNRASPAEGSADAHAREQARIVEDALGSRTTAESVV